MAWECADCGDRQEMDFVCHHCGKAVCGNHGIKIRDNAFVEDVNGDLPYAAHCQSCLALHHSRTPARWR